MSTIAVDTQLAGNEDTRLAKPSTREGWTRSLIEALTLEEKVALLSGRSFCDTPGVPRLNVASLKVSDGPSGE